MSVDSAVLIALIGAVASTAQAMINHRQGQETKKIAQDTHTIAQDTQDKVDGRLGQFLALADKVTHRRKDDVHMHEVDPNFWTERITPDDRSNDPRT